MAALLKLLAIVSNRLHQTKKPAQAGFFAPTPFSTHRVPRMPGLGPPIKRQPSIVDSMDLSARYLVFHGSIVLLFGLLCGIPYGRAINRNAPAQTVHSWRIAHASLPMGAILMFAVAALLSSFAVATQVKWFIAATLIVSAYAFCFSLPLAAVVGHRGLSSRGPFLAKLVFAGNMLGSIASLAASIALVYAGYKSL